MTKKIIYRILLIMGVVNASTIILSALTGPNAYVLANNLPGYLFYVVLGYVPLALVSIAFMWWLIDLYRKPVSKINYVAIAFCGILSDAVFVIGSVFYAS